MRKASERVWSLIAPVVESLGFELIGIEHVQQGRHSVLCIYIDHPDGITVDNCAEVSHQVSGLLDVEDPIKGNYNLEVSSPGLDRPLFTLEHFAKYIGHPVKIRLNSPIEGRRNLKGTILSVENQDIEVQVDDLVFTLNLDEIDTARLVPVFD